MEPATCGVAMEVPLALVPWLPLRASVEKMLRPGAELSGFRAVSPRRGPRELNYPMVFTRVWTVIAMKLLYSFVNVTLDGRLALSEVPTANVVMMARIEVLPATV